MSGNPTHPNEEKVNRVLMKANQKIIALKDNVLIKNGQEVTSDLSGLPISDPLSQGYLLMRNYYKNLISKPFENVVVLTGAGTSKSSGGKIMRELWEEAFPSTEEENNLIFFKSINFLNPTTDAEKNLEKLLSQAQKACGVLIGDECEKVKAKIKIVEDLVIKACTIPIAKTSPHLQFLNKITSRKLKYSRVKVFTLNYDTLFEQAAVEGSFIVINGFSFSDPHYFSGAFFDYDVVNRKNSRVSQEENFINKVFHLYKPHGSINWEKLANEKIISRDIQKACESPLIIYPNSNKYESGYDQPFFEMMSRFQQSVRQSNTLLICVGFSFGDKHFKSVVKEAVKSNPGLNLLVAIRNFTAKPDIKDLLDLTDSQNNITFIDENFQNFAEHYPFSLEYEFNEE